MIINWQFVYSYFYIFYSSTAPSALMVAISDEVKPLTL